MSSILTRASTSLSEPSGGSYFPPSALPALTGLRFFAALGVVLYHFVNLPGLWPPAHALIARGYLGVPFFFILSGFVLGYNYFPAARAGRFQSREFWRARLARLYPAYLLALVLLYSAVRLQYGQKLSPGVFAGSGIVSLLMLQDWTPAWRDIWNTPGWTLSIEAFFYAVFPLLLGLRELGAGREPARIRHGKVALGILLALGLMYLSWRLPAGAAAPAWARWPWKYLPLFLLGLVLARAHELGWPRGGRGWLGLGGAAAIMAIITVPGLCPAGQIDHACSMLFGAVVLGFADTGAWISRALGHPALEKLGEASYSLYILQVPVWVRLDWYWHDAMHAGWLPARWGLHSPAFITVMLMTEIAASLAAYRWVERPLRRWIRGWGKQNFQLRINRSGT